MSRSATDDIEQVCHDGTPRPARPLSASLLSGLALSGLALSGLLLSGCAGSKGGSPDIGLGPVGGVPGGIEATAPGDGANAANPKKPGDGTAGAEPPGSSGQPGESTAQGGGGQPAQGGSGSSAPGNGGASSGSGSAGSNANTATKMIRINWWNDTRAKPPKNPVVEFAGKMVKPKAGKSDVLRIGPCPVGKDLKLVVMPDGPGGKRLVATFRVTRSMIADSEQDAIHVEVRDDSVRVLGNPVLNFEQTLAR